MDPGDYETAIFTLWNLTPDERAAQRWARAYHELTQQVTAGDRPSSTLHRPDHALVADLIHSARTHSIATRILDRHSLRPRSVLEVGAGVGPLALASGATDSCLLDADHRALDRAITLATLLGAPPPRTLVQPLTAAHLPPADLVAFPFVLNEVERQGVDPVGLVRRALTPESSTGHVLVIEPGTPAAAARIQRLRTALLDHVLAPCPNHGPCPLAATEPDWCHFTHDAPLGPWASRIGALAHRRPERTAYTYLLLSSTPSAPSGGARALSIVRTEHAKLRVYVCASGRYEPWTALRRHPVYQAMTRILPGDRLSLPHSVDRKGDGLRIQDPDDVVSIPG